MADLLRGPYRPNQYKDVMLPMIKGHDIDNIRFGDSFTSVHLAGKRFDYLLANPPFGVKWEAQQNFVKREHEE